MLVISASITLITMSPVTSVQLFNFFAVLGELTTVPMQITGHLSSHGWHFQIPFSSWKFYCGSDCHDLSTHLNRLVLRVALDHALLSFNLGLMVSRF